MSNNQNQKHSVEIEIRRRGRIVEAATARCSCGAPEQTWVGGYAYATDPVELAKRYQALHETGQ